MGLQPTTRLSLRRSLGTTDRDNPAHPRIDVCTTWQTSTHTQYARNIHGRGLRHREYSRPITTVSSNANDPQALTPSMLLTMKTQPLTAPPGNFTKEDLYGRQRWRRVQYLVDQFWVRWRKEYLQSLQPRQKWNNPRPNINNGDVVLLQQNEFPRNDWPLARVVKTYLSDDGKVRKADVTVCSDGNRRTYLRPISELILLERSPDSEDT